MSYREPKWNPEQCSYCGNKNTQFVCWKCHEADIEDLREEIKKLREEFELLAHKNGLIVPAK